MVKNLNKDKFLIDLEVSRRFAQIIGPYLGTGFHGINFSYIWYMVAGSGFSSLYVALKTPSRYPPKKIRVLKKAVKGKEGPYIVILNIGLSFIHVASLLYGIDLAIKGLI